MHDKSGFQRNSMDERRLAILWSDLTKLGANALLECPTGPERLTMYLEMDRFRVGGCGSV